MKKIMIVLSFLFVLSGCTQVKESSLDRVEEIVEINYEQLKEKLGSDTNFLLYIGRPDCKDCQEFYPLLEGYVKETNQGIYYLNVKKFRDDSRKEGAKQEEIDFFNHLKETLDYDWTPTLQLYVNGKKADEFDFLSMEYYNIENEEERQVEYDKFVTEFKKWLDKNY